MKLSTATQITGVFAVLLLFSCAWVCPAYAEGVSFSAPYEDEYDGPLSGSTDVANPGDYEVEVYVTTDTDYQLKIPRSNPKEQVLWEGRIPVNVCKITAVKGPKIGSEHSMSGVVDVSNPSDYKVRALLRADILYHFNEVEISEAGEWLATSPYGKGEGDAVAHLIRKSDGAVVATSDAGGRGEWAFVRMGMGEPASARGAKSARLIRRSDGKVVAEAWSWE